ncbi:MAG: DUF4920 domain-containing protein [Sphingobacteriales bacterium]|nr:DUF4920 domain-containing protein [Sphingobacteriales bacterium]
MKKIIYVLTACILFACQSTTRNMGEQFEVKSPVSIDALTKQLDSIPSATDIQIEGTVAKSCMSEGCWFTIKDADGTEILLDIKDKSFKVPTNSPGQTVIVLADAVKNSSAKSDEEPYNISVRGMRFK